MVEEILKKGSNLSVDEIKALEEIFLLINPNMPENHLQINHIDKTNPVFHIFKVNDKIAAFQAYSLFKAVTPFRNKALPIIYINLSYKDPSKNAHIKNFAKRSNLSFIKRSIGSLWFLKSFLVIFETYNPKLVERISPFFSRYYPNVSNPTPKAIQQFGQDFFRDQLKVIDPKIDEDLIKQEGYFGLSDISDKWNQMYESVNLKRNQFFIEKGVIEKRDEEYFLTGKAVLFIGYYSFWSILLKRFKKKSNL